MTGREPDTRELLAQALDLVVGAVSLSRYASNRAGDARQRRVFQQVAAAGQQQERLLKEQLAQFAGVHRDSPGTDVKRALAYAGATAIGTALAFLCGAIAFEFAGKPERLHNCHCSRCRRARGAAHATNAMFQRGQLTWLSGEGDVVSYKLPGAKRFGQDFCRHCGSAVPRVVASTGYVVVPCGSLDTSPGIPVQSHIFVGSKAPWHEITDRIPQWEARPA